METYIALLFSIGIAGNQRLKMADWRAMLEDLGLQNPRTLIATGNAVFECHTTHVRALELKLEDAFEQRFGRRVDTIVHPASFYRRLVQENPFPKEAKADGSRVIVRIMREPLKNGVMSALSPYLTQGERVKIIRGHAWVHFKHEPNRSGLLRVLASKRLGIGTMRNWNTVRRLSEMVDAE